MKQNLIDLYLKQVKKHCPSSFRKKLMTELKSNLLDFLDDYPDSTLEDICRHFGSPETFSSEYILTMDDEQRQKLINHSKWNRRCVLAGIILIVLIILTTAVWIIHENSQHVTPYYHEIITDLSQSDNLKIKYAKDFQDYKNI